MTMNEGFFGQYSVFCVFGSVVGCVVVPLIAQVLQQQSMECVILSAIVISLTAAHLNKKGGNDPSYSKILIPKELERKKVNHNNNNSSNKRQKNHAHQQHFHSAQQIQSEQEYLQQHEHLKNIEMERRGEEKRLKKIRKREERLKKREEENKKQKELEEHYRSIKEKRLKQQKENYCRTNRKYLESAAQNLDKFCGSNHNEDNKRCGLTNVDTNRILTKSQRTLSSSSNTSHYQQNKIPRFERHRAGSSPPCSCTSEQSFRSCSMNDENTTPHHIHSSPLGGSGGGGGGFSSSCSNTSTNNLSIKCSLSASCSSLSSISSSESGTSPPILLPVSPPCKKLPWVIPTTTSTPKQQHTDSLISTLLPAAKLSSSTTAGILPTLTQGLTAGLTAATTTPIKLFNDGGSIVTRPSLNTTSVERSVKSYSNTRVTKSRAAKQVIPDNSSLFCSQLDGLNGKTATEAAAGRESQPIVGEYSLFGPQRFATSFARM